MLPDFIFSLDLRSIGTSGKRMRSFGFFFVIILGSQRGSSKHLYFHSVSVRLRVNHGIARMWLTIGTPHTFNCTKSRTFLAMTILELNFIRHRLWQALVFLEVIVLFLVQVALDTTQSQDVTNQWIVWSTGYCSYEDHKDIKKVFIRQCSLSRFLEVNVEDDLAAGICGPEDERFRTEPADRSCRSDRCVLAVSVGSILGVVLILITLGVAIYLYRRNPRTDRKLLSENIYDEAVYDVRPAAQQDRQPMTNAIKNDGENIELVENDLYDMDIPSPKTPKEQTGKFLAGDCNIYEAVP